ncbi:hypothetical protein N868_02610 [Cellulomonas carbonis T26]|uniref:Pyrrolo-quinoline quinone n=1 Tax=Cellulomonas carbonis T26 TaxID=947969 RepID=A0A0A0BWM3_9CELL|nr:hypothetical protein N868_02610 [Cellulomonas carbonis T26]
MRASTSTAVVSAAVVVAGLAACTGPGGAPPAVTAAASPAPLEPPVAGGEPAPTAEPDPGMLPYGYVDHDAVAPGWVGAPLEADGVFVGPGTTPAGDDAVIAVDSTGTVLWTASGPDTTRVDLTRADGRALAVLSVPTGGTDWSAAAYDLVSGEPVWGPVRVPGEPAGPGLVVGTGAARVALDARTGATVDAPADGVVLAERAGVVVSRSGTDLRATHDGDLRWTVGPAELDLPPDATPALVAEATPPPGMLVVGADDDGGPRTGTLVALDDGAVVATDVRDVRADAVLGGVVALGDGTLSAHADDGPVWSRDVPEGAELAAVAGVLAYLRVGDEVMVVNTATGADAVAYDAPGPGGLAVPAVVAATGAAAMLTDEWVLLTTSTPDGR